jgi:hypothetical protein
MNKVSVHNAAGLSPKNAPLNNRNHCFADFYKWNIQEVVMPGLVAQAYKYQHLGD